MAETGYAEALVLIRRCAQKILDIIQNSDLSLALEKERIVLRNTEDGKPFLEIRTITADAFIYTLKIVPYYGMHLCDFIHAVTKEAKAYGCHVSLEGGSWPDADECTDRFERVWFDPNRRNPAEGDTVLVEIESGEMIWCRYRRNEYITEATGITGAEKAVIPYRWAWTYE